MTSFAPTPHGPGSSTTRMRVKWDNVMIVLIGIVVAAFAVVGILLYADTGAPGSATKPTPDATADVSAAEPAAADTAPGELSLDDAVSVVDEVRVLMTEGRWVEASDRLELVPAELRDASGATVAQAELDERRGDHERLRAQLDAAVEARNWTGARGIVTKLAALAPLDADLTATKDLIDTALAPKATPAATPKAGANVSGGGAAAPAEQATSGSAGTSTASKPRPKPKPATSATKPAATGARPATGTVRPPIAGGGAASTTGSSGGSSTGAAAASTGASTGASATGANDVIAGIGAGSSLGGLGIQLTPQQEAELEAALAEAMAGL